MSESYDYKLFAWAIDFVRCVEEFPTWRKWLLRFALGKYASREYVGLREHLEKEWDVSMGYGLEETTYHKEAWSWIRK